MNRNRLQSSPSNGSNGSIAIRAWVMSLMALFTFQALFATHLPEYVAGPANLHNGRIVRDFRHCKDLKTPFDFKIHPESTGCIGNKPILKVPAANTGDSNDPGENDGYKVKVKLRFSEDSRVFYNTFIYIFNEEYADRFTTYEARLDEDLSWTFNVPEGIYDIFVAYELEYQDRSMRTICISHSDVEVKSDMEETMYNTEATHLLALEKYLPDGERVVLPKVTYLDEEPWYEVDYSEATAYGYTGFQDLYNPVIGDLYGAIVIASEYIENSDERYGIWVSDMSDKYTFTESIFIETIEHSVCVVSENTYMTESVLNAEDYHFDNNYKNYSTVNRVPVHHAPTYYEIPEYARTQGWNITPWINAVSIGTVELNMIPGSELWVCFSEDHDKGNSPIQLSFSQTSTEDIMTFPGAPEGDYFPINMVSLPKIMIDGEWTVINNNHQNYGGCTLHNWPEGIIPVPGAGLPWPQLPGHEAYTFLEKDCEMILGNSCPINYLTTKYDVIGVNEDHTGFIYGNTLVNHYLGRIGEARLMDSMYPFYVKFNGEDLDIDDSIYSSLGNWYRAFANDTQRAPGEVEITMIDNNVTVDDIVGSNVTTISYDERSEENWLPTLTMMITKNTEGKITDRFNTSEEGIVEFSAGDFNFVDPWYVCDPIDVKVEYAPYGSEDFEELEYVEVPELFMMPNFGYFYRVSLDQVTRKSANGWFTMRFTVTDKVGNRQTQIIEPAFYIEEPSSVEIISSDFVKASVYSAEGLYVGEVSSVEDCNDFQPGIYILRYAGKNGAVSKKIIVR